MDDLEPFRGTLFADLVLAHRFLYYVRNRPIVSDAVYDRLEKAALEGLAPHHPLHGVGSDQEASYPASIRALVLYLEMRPYELAKLDVPQGVKAPGMPASAPEELDLDIPEEEEPAPRGAKKDETPSLF